ncbi:uncharacterized protein B0I36DRAFT_366548 [Microdochium trichocladiopsis]|uniref:Uncharacterized protein n=1 Tax=Microdochium trichocladiopsis TaxID=1682393 RepID=A0A9P8XXY6_9PEZI|nr:uncharacterized protein B0I36DRAFT_366548 [Microdochium trichocladiopsis]KAH7024619.1 hypothetical protein B0I36DRAFT_366548 [Microdochium trichocladiopsis]
MDVPSSFSEPAGSGSASAAEHGLVFANFWVAVGLSSVFTPCALVHAAQLLRRATVRRTSKWLLAGKITSGVAFVALNATLVALGRDNDTFVPFVLALVASVAALALSIVAQFKLRRPSNLLGAYLFLSLLSSVARAQQLWLDSRDSSDRTVAILLTTTSIVHLLFLAINTKESKQSADYDYQSHSPEETSSIFSLSLYSWLNQLLWKGYKQVLALEDLYPLDQDISAARVPSTVSPSQDAATGHSRAWTILKWATRPVLKSLLIPILPRLCLLGFTFCQPFFIHTLLTFLSSDGGDTGADPRVTANGLVGAAVLIYTGIAVSTALYWYHQERAQSRLRAFLVSSIYERTSILSSSASSSPATSAAKPNGKPTPSNSSSSPSSAAPSAAVTLMSTEVDAIYLGTRNIHELWANVIETALATYLLSRELTSPDGESGRTNTPAVVAAPLAIVAAGFLASFAMSKYAVGYQRDWMRYIQARVSATGHVLSHIKDLRTSGMIAPARDMVQDGRVEEIARGSRMRGVINLSASMSQIPMALAPVATFAVAGVAGVLGSGSGSGSGTATAFTALSYLSLLTSPLMVVLQTLPILAGCWACLDRVWEFVHCSGVRKDARVLVAGGSSDVVAGADGEKRGALDTTLGADDDAVVIKDGCFGWKQGEPTLRDINLCLPRGSITMVTGPVASGKSTLCRALLGEVPFSTGRVVIAYGSSSGNVPRTSYCDQTPFLMNGSIRENIAGFDSSFSQERYQQVIHATCLEQDFDSLPLGDATHVGSKGVSLSGGQRQRISLARALYHSLSGRDGEGGLVILDDVFTGLDGNTQNLICDRVFGRQSGLLRRRPGLTVVLCSTQAVKFRHFANRLVYLDSDGTIARQEAPEEAMEMSGRDKASLAISPAAPASTSPSILGQRTSESSPPNKNVLSLPSKSTPPATLSASESPSSRPLTDRAVYKHYFSSIGILPIAVYVILVASVGFTTNFPTVWLQFLVTDLSSSTPAHSFAYYMGIYGLLAALSVLSVFLAGGIVMLVFVRLSGTNLHQQTLDTALGASLRFLTTTDTGTILNLFSQDMTIIDTQLPRMVNNFSFSLATVLGQAAVIAASSGYLAVSYPFFAALLWVLQRFYLPTSKQLRILDLEAKSPLYTHFLDTIAGLSTIRAYGAFPAQIARNRALLDTSQRPNYLLAMAQQWLLLTMNMIVAVLGVILAVLATNLPRDGGGGAGGGGGGGEATTSSGSVGAGLVMLMRFGAALSMVINAYTGLEISLGGIGRLKKFAEDTEREDRSPPGTMDQHAAESSLLPATELGLDNTWPRQGRIELRNVSASYSGDPEALVLKDVSLSIKAREKVALVGRTGSGKSSLVALLLRLFDPIATADHAHSYSGITIDEVPLNTIDRTALRARHIIAVSQDVVFLPASSAAEPTSIRDNLDPWDAATLDEAIAALQTVGLYETLLAKFPQGIDGAAVVATTGEVGKQLTDELSVGQRQLFSLARAVLRRRVRKKAMDARGLEEGGVLLLDEFTASVDAQTEEQMLDILRREFAAYTVVMVTHSVESARRWCDRVVVMDQGSVVSE